MNDYKALSQKVDQYNGTADKLRTDVDAALQQCDHVNVRTIYEDSHKKLKEMLRISQTAGYEEGSGEVRRKVEGKVSSVKEVIEYIERKAKEQNIQLPEI